jgi:hypothetical protein
VKLGDWLPFVNLPSTGTTPNPVEGSGQRGCRFCGSAQTRAVEVYGLICRRCAHRMLDLALEFEQVILDAFGMRT